ncbi:MAG: helix-turn-helix domain-containing protein [Acidobacteria bacterium]|nr:helix-turn-helix domain-containing protein [Acidobacteriota bacterium]
MKSMGESLRKEREARGVSLQEISEETKISVRFLQAIEEENFDRLPGGIFNKNFIRQYARYLGLDEESAIRDYLQITAGEQEPPAEAPSAEVPASPAGSGYLRLVVAAICLGALAVGLVYGLYRLKNSMAAAPPSVSASSGAPAAASPPEGDAETSPAPETPVGTAASETPSKEARTEPATTGQSAPQQSAPELQLKIDSIAPVWLSITADGAVQWQGILAAEQTRQIEASDSIHLTIGDAGAVDLSLNGNAIPPLGHRGEVKKVTITAKGLEPSP